ncbi:cystathionine gamma-synthase family protein [Urechidicola sp. KH5]
MKTPDFKPESLMMSYGHNPKEAFGAVKSPLYQTSTFAFNSAEEGKAYFELAYGLREPEKNEELGMIYSRLNNPNLSVLEKRLCLWDKSEDAAVFESGMAAISTVFMEFLNPGDLLVYTLPTYGGTHHFIEHFLPKMGIHAIGIYPDQDIEEVKKLIVDSGKSAALRMMYLETPANPSGHLLSIADYAALAMKFSQGEREVLTVVDNTFMGPVWQHPLKHGADLVVYSATKYIGGHSDVVAGAVLGNAELMQQVKVLRTFLGNMCSPHTAWLLQRSLETLQVRMDRQAKNAALVADYIVNHEEVAYVNYLGHLKPESKLYDTYKKQCTAPGAMIAFYIKGGEAETFAFLNALKLVKLAVSLGGTESLIQHPYAMTHAGVDPEIKERMDITESLVRLSVGLEHPDDLIADIEQAFKAMKSLRKKENLYS